MQFATHTVRVTAAAHAQHDEHRWGIFQVGTVRAGWILKIVATTDQLQESQWLSL